MTWDEDINFLEHMVSERRVHTDNGLYPRQMKEEKSVSHAQQRLTTTDALQTRDYSACAIAHDCAIA
jgi:hypothetical protein